MKNVVTTLSLLVMLASCGQKQAITNTTTNGANNSKPTDSIDAVEVKMPDAVADTTAVKKEKEAKKPYTIDIDKKETPAKTAPIKNVPAQRITVYGKWVLESLNGKKATNASYKNGIPYIDIDGAKNTITGFGGCNKMNGECTIVEGHKFKIEKLIATKMYCEGVPENELFALLRGTHDFTTTGDKLMINEGGAVKAVFFRPYE